VHRITRQRTAGQDYILSPEKRRDLDAIYRRAQREFE
jgi:hypothetical protein